MSDFDNDENDTEGIKNLRKQFEAQAKELKELREYREAQERAQRSASVASALKAKAGDDAQLASRLAKAAKFYDGDDTSDEAVTKWLDENADIFGISKNEQQAAEEAATERVVNSSFGEGVVVDNGLAGLPLGDIEKRRQLLRDLPYEEAVRQGLIPAVPGRA